ncbi:hypothetical protein HX001_00125 [Empedobacter brevis]|uniref:DUF6046 domain-containing protein n=1 Tax=Empedobacter brevis TaxID=247 RepID=A0AAJ1QBG9_9FLAO|nr:DUF6046 domain-containing protein [Empedobacter brevis]MDM1070891.1 hypothetical protein [Empedobacter brevis]
MEFDFKEIVANSLTDYIAPPFPKWWGNNKTKFVLPDLLGVNRNQLLGGQYFQTLELQYNGENYLFPNEPLIGLTLAKTIVETATVGKYRKGTVDEYICTEDYRISIRGLCFSEDMETYPAEQVAMLNELFDINDGLEILNNPFLELFGIRKITLLEINFDEMQGEQGLQRYFIRAKSSQDFYAELDESYQSIQNLLS